MNNHKHTSAAVKPSTVAKYFCPMCPGIESDTLGDCPKCGMALELKNVTAAASEDDNTELQRAWNPHRGGIALPIFPCAIESHDFGRGYEFELGFGHHQRTAIAANKIMINQKTPRTVSFVRLPAFPRWPSRHVSLHYKINNKSPHISVYEQR